METILEFLKEAKIYYLGTMENGKPTMRPFGTVHLFEEKLYIQTGRKKAVYRQMKRIPASAFVPCPRVSGSESRQKPWKTPALKQRSPCWMPILP